MLGAIIGDIVGSRFEWNNIKSREFEFFSHNCCFTDDSVMSLAVARAILNCKNDYSDLGKKAIVCMQEVGKLYPDCGYGGQFRKWIYKKDPRPYNSWGNGAAMRVSACGFAGRSLEEVAMLSRRVTEVTHNHPEGIKGAEAAAVAVYLARTGSSIAQIRAYISRHYYPMDFTLDGIRDSYRFDVSCQGTVPQAIMAFLESTGFEDAIRNAISIGGDSDTLAAICGGIAEAYYGIPEDIREQALTFLDQRLLDILNDFEAVYGICGEKPGPLNRTQGETPDISIRVLQEYLLDRYGGWANDQSMFMKLVEELGETAEVLNKMAGRKASQEEDLPQQLGMELADMIHYIVAIAALNHIDLTEVMLEKDKIASEKYRHDINLETFLHRREKK